MVVSQLVVRLQFCPHGWAGYAPKESAHRSNCAVGFFQDVFPIFATYLFNGGIDCIDQLSLAMPLGRRAPYSILQVVCLVDHYHLDFLIHQAVLAAVDSKEMCSEEILVTEDNAICVFHIITECGVLAAV